MIATVKMQVEVTVRVSLSDVPTGEHAPRDSLAWVRAQALQLARLPLDVLEVDDPDHTLGVTNVSHVIGSPEVLLAL